MFYHLRQRVRIKKGQKIGLCLSKSISPCMLLLFFFFLNIRNFEVWTLDPQYLKKKSFLLTNTSLKGEKRTRKSSFKNARKQSKMGKQGKKRKGNSSLLILKLSTGKVSFFRILRATHLEF